MSSYTNTVDLIVSLLVLPDLPIVILFLPMVSYRDIYWTCMSIFARECSSFIEMLNALNFQKHHRNYVYCATEFVCCATT